MVTISSFSIATASRVSARKAGIAEARKVSPSPTPATSGHSLRAPTSWSGLVGVHGDEGVVAAQLGEGGADGGGEIAVVVAGDQVGDDLGVGFRAELLPFALEARRSLAWFSTIPLRTMWTRSELSLCGWAFSSVTRPWVAQRVWATPVVAGGAATATPPLPSRSSIAARRLARLPTARTLSICPSSMTEIPAES